MKAISHKVKALACGALLLCCAGLQAQSTFTATGAKLPKHYFNTIIILDSYRKPNVPIKDTTDVISKRLKSYAVRQFNLSFCVPIFTKNDFKDTTVIKNSHLLLTGNYTLLRPVFDGISDHRLVRAGIGLRYIYNTGKKGVWFIDVEPFITRDATYGTERYARLASTIVYSHNASDHFNWRIGVTKSFIWGNRFYWPFIGLRFGRLDKVNFSLQFPRAINLNVPLNSRLVFSAYSKAQGGIYNFSNHDSLYYKKQDAVFNFARYEVNTGLRLDVRVSRNFNFYVAAGISSRNNLIFYSESTNKNRPRLPYRTYFYSQHVGGSGFFNLGLVLKFGKTRSIYNNRNMYDAVNLNSTLNGDGNALVPLPPKKQRSDLNLESVKDLVDYNDL